MINNMISFNLRLKRHALTMYVALAVHLFFINVFFLMYSVVRNLHTIIMDINVMAME